MAKILICGGRVIDAASEVDQVLDVYVEDGVIKKLGENLTPPEDCKIIDASGCWVTPGLIDLHTHVREPGFEYKEDVVTCTKSAVAGGYTTICAMPNTNPVTDNGAVVQQIIQRAKKDGCAHVLPVASVTKEMAGQELTDIDSLVQAGACAISEDGKTVINARLHKKAMAEAAKGNIPVMCHCEDFELSNKGALNEGVIAKLYHVGGISNDSESVIVAREALIAKSVGAHVHICHVSTKDSVDLIRYFKSIGVSITAEATPHHFALNDEAIQTGDANYKMAPPLRSETDRAAVLNGLVEGVIDVIATDHAPHSQEDKGPDLKSAAFGIVGLETSFSIAHTKLVDSGLLSPMALIDKMSCRPAGILGIDKGTLQVGKDADITIINPTEEYTVNIHGFHSKSKNSPFHGMKVKGRVHYTLVQGKVVFEKGRVS